MRASRFRVSRTTLRAALCTALIAVGTIAGGTAIAAPPTMSVEGDVVAAHSRWTADGSRIITEATVRTAAGDVVVSQLGGTVDGLTMRTFPGPEILAPGMRVAVGAHADVDLAQRAHVVVDRVRVLAQPPGFVRTGPTKAGGYLYWESGCVYVTADAAGTRQLPNEVEHGVIDAAIAAWNDGVAGCSFMNIVREPNQALEVGGRDRINVIKFRDASWCRPAVGDDPMRCHSPSAAGLTTAVYVDDGDSARDGAIVDADIELNGVDFAISVNGDTLGTASCLADLANTLTHELGHLLGLEHPCRTGSDPPRVDGDGNPVPLCGSTSDPAIIDATMYNFQDCGETSKATLSSDEVTAICSVYPLAEDPGTCEHVDDDVGCCSASGGVPVPGLVSGALVLGFLVLRRRPRKNSARG